MTTCYKAVLKKSDWKKENGEFVQSVEIKRITENSSKIMVDIDWNSCENYTHKEKVFYCFKRVHKCTIKNDKIIFHLSKTNEAIIDIPITIFKINYKEEN